MMESLFIVAAGLALLAALLTVSAHNAVHALLYLLTMMLALALIFLMLGSPFAAALQVIIYAGAIMVLFVFVTMMLHRGELSLSEERRLFYFNMARGPLLLSAVLLLELLVVITQLPPEYGMQAQATGALSDGAGATSALVAPGDISVKALARLLFGDYLLLVVLAALLLLAALVAAIHVSRLPQAAPETATVAEPRPMPCTGTDTGTGKQTSDEEPR
ncbi:NADH-quinone oxidoreductase subunit J family protein [Shewanella salipaludis]|nr:NADH-quinone oxidoreductase subunit J [Shewanella salipaludis]